MTARQIDFAQPDETIPPLGERPWDGPDMQDALPVAIMLERLATAGNVDLTCYIRLWRSFAQSVGGSVGFMRSADKAPELLIACPVDAQRRHRLRWLHFLTEDLLARCGGREALEAEVARSPYPTEPSTPYLETSA